MRTLPWVAAGAVLLFHASAIAGTSVVTLRASCKSNKARAFLPTLESGIQFKDDFDELKTRLPKLNAPVFCGCYYDQMEKQFGSEKTSEMSGLYTSGSPTQIQQDRQAKEKIMFSCFGQQFGKANLTPPSPEETRRAMARPRPR